MADLVLPATFPWESGGSFTNSLRKVQQIQKQIDSPAERNGFEQLRDLLAYFNLNTTPAPADALNEAVSLMPRRGDFKDLRFEYKEKDNFNRQFDHGCDSLNKLVDEEFKDKLGW